MGDAAARKEAPGLPFVGQCIIASKSNEVLESNEDLGVIGESF
jgi:hypothetical protein